jgi:hypothetical protein
MFKYEIGDKIKVRKDLVVGQEYGEDSFEQDMDYFKGRVVTIVDKSKVMLAYRVGEDGEVWNWTEEMFE